MLCIPSLVLNRKHHTENPSGNYSLYSGVAWNEMMESIEATMRLKQPHEPIRGVYNSLVPNQKHRHQYGNPIGTFKLTSIKNTAICYQMDYPYGPSGWARD